nr:hypothetical protein [Tanacetum cinerariifolium]
SPATVEMVNATKESFDEDDLAKFQELLLDVEKPLYKRCPDFTKLSAIVKLLNLKGKYGASDKFFAKLLRMLKKMLPAEKDEQATTAQIPVNATIEFVDDTNFNMDFGSRILTDSPATVEMVNATKESFDEDDLAKFQELLLDVEKPLYKRCPDFTKLSAIVKLLNLKGKYGASDKFFAKLLRMLKKMLPAGNKMVEITNQTKKLMRMMGS